MNALPDLMELANTRVSVGMAAIVLFGLYVGYRTARRAVKTVTWPFKIFASTYMAACTLIGGGLAMSGYGIGELCADPYQQQSVRKSTNVYRAALTNDELLTLTNRSPDKREHIRLVLEYAKERDKASADNESLANQVPTTPPVAIEQPTEVERPINHRLGWMTTICGAGLFILGIFVGGLKINRDVE